MRDHIFMGAATALVTPFDREGKVNFPKLQQLIDFQLAGGCDALVLCGTSGEYPTLTAQERGEIVACAVQRVNGRVPVIAGAGGNCTAETVRQCKMMEEAGADALLLITPYWNQCTQHGLVLHYAACAEGTGLPFLLYNAPSRTGMTIAAETYEKLLKIANVRAVKEASGSIEHCIKLKRLYGDRLDVYCGTDSLNAPMLEAGACGLISVLANLVPGAMHNLCSRYFAGDAERSTALQIRYSSLIEALNAEVNPIPVKTAMNLLGMDVGGFRLPLCPGGRELEGRLREELALLQERGDLI